MSLGQQQPSDVVRIEQHVKSPEVNFLNSVRRCVSRKTSKKPALSGCFLAATHPFLKI